ncbi:flavodoxin family protein [Lunatimonas salinarum]|uniref:flavodoxin family protein n=1 Tax=Lunatimonas salinarum TaxID=1774590 RepID=UPI001FD72CDF|nr:flavodoxin family protein [Lunatimonas salinarum]
MLLVIFVIPLFVKAQEPPKILIAYFSSTGNTQSMAVAVAKGASNFGGVTVQVKEIASVTDEDLISAQAIILGSPVYNANVPPKVQEFINSWPFENRPFFNKLGAVFVTGGGFSIGEEAVMFSLIRAMMIHGMVILGGTEVEAAFGASAITGEGPYAATEVQEVFLQKAEGLGHRVAQWASRLDKPTTP